MNIKVIKFKPIFTLSYHIIKIPFKKILKITWVCPASFHGTYPFNPRLIRRYPLVKHLI